MTRKGSQVQVLYGPPLNTQVRCLALIGVTTTNRPGTTELLRGTFRKHEPDSHPTWLRHFEGAIPAFGQFAWCAVPILFYLAPDHG